MSLEVQSLDRSESSQPDNIARPVPLHAKCRQIFDSVFPSGPLSDVLLIAEDTSSTFEIVLPGEEPCPPPPPDFTTSPDQQTWKESWSIAVEFLSIPDRKLNFSPPGKNDSEERDDVLLERWSRDTGVTDSILTALHYVGSRTSPGRLLREGVQEYDLQEWYMGEVRRHFLQNFRDTLSEETTKRRQEAALPRIMRFLKLAQHIYFTPFSTHILPLNPQDYSFNKLQQCLHSIIAYALPYSQFSGLLAETIASEGLTILGIQNVIRRNSLNPDSSTTGISADGMDVDQIYSVSYRDWKNEPSVQRRVKMMIESEDVNVIKSRHRLLNLLNDIQDVGLGGTKAQPVFANVMNNLITKFVTTAYSREWESPSFVVDHLRHWIENVFARLVVQVLDILQPSDTEISTPDEPTVTLGDVEKWQDIALARLGALRVSELFEIIVEWDSSSGAIEDLKNYTTNPATRLDLTNSFSTTLVNRLLHPGASTVDILQLYISTIRAFTLLDPRGVLLDRLARPIRRYLRERDDTIKVIVSGLLANPVDDNNTPPDPLGELAVELSKAHQLALLEGRGELDWNDMNWIPDPIDAAADYKKSKHSDVIGSLVSLFESKDVFVKELQQTLSDRLLQNKKDFDLEISVLELLKLRFGESSMQACDVMMRDALDSRRVDAVIRADQKLEDRIHYVDHHTPEEIPEIHAKILSRLFWPSLSDQTYKVPEEISSLQARYAAGFETLKPSRKLTWLNTLGTVVVELDLNDRLFSDEVTPWQASVIYAFQSSSYDPADCPVTKTVSELAYELEMTPSLVRSACLFWLSKRVLTEPSPDTFSVLETLPDDEEDMARDGAEAQPGDNGATSTDVTAAAAAAAVAEAEAARESAEAAAMEKMNMYWQFIVGMLTNQGAMPLQRIIMMLKIAVPGGFPFSSEELKEFLGQMVAKGNLEMLGGGNYRIINNS